MDATKAASKGVGGGRLALISVKRTRGAYPLKWAELQRDGTVKLEYAPFHIPVHRTAPHTATTTIFGSFGVIDTKLTKETRI